MELQDYVAALRRYWKTWVGLTVVGVLAALSVVLLSTPSYQATSTVFVASAGDGTSGSQFVNQRVTSYPDIATSRAVLAPVIAAKGLDESVAAMRLKVDACNPTDTSLIKIVVSDDDPAWAADTANAIADEFRTVVEDLERPDSGDSPVRLTVTDRANVPTIPVFPKPTMLYAVGLVAGLAVGLAAAILQSRRDTRVHRKQDVRAAWGPEGDQLTVYSMPPARRRKRTASPTPATMLTCRLDAMAQRGEVSLLAVPLSPDAEAQAFVEDVRRQLEDWGTPVTVTDASADAPALGRPGVSLRLAGPGTPFPQLRRMTGDRAGVVLLLEAGRSDRARLQEMRSLLEAAESRVLAVVLLPPRRRRRKNLASAGPSATVPVQRPGTRGDVPAAEQRTSQKTTVGA